MTTTQHSRVHGAGPRNSSVVATSAVPTADGALDRTRSEKWSGLTPVLFGVDIAAAVAGTAITRPGWQWGLFVGLTLLVSRGIARLYRRRLGLSYYREIPRALVATTAAFGLVTALEQLMAVNAHTVIAVAATFAWFVALAALPRMAVFQAGRWARRRLGRCERAVVLGTGKLGVDLAQSMIDHPEFGLRPVGFLDPVGFSDTADLGPAAKPPVSALQLPLLTGGLREALVASRAGVIVVAAQATDDQLVDAAITANQHGATILTLPRLWELHQDGAHIERLRGYPLQRLASAPTQRPSWWVKCAFDSMLATLALILLLPLLAMAALAVLLESGRPMLFRQERIGLDGRTFELLKFRSMRPADETESQTRWNVAGDPRIGPVGRMLRRSSIDELPQLWNILRGDMSLVGPRPERPGFVAEFTQVHERYWARHRVPAGLTGLAQINGLRGDTSIADRCRYDNYYIANWSLWLDLRILLLTCRELFRTGQH